MSRHLLSSDDLDHAGALLILDTAEQLDRTLARTGTKKAILTTLKWARLFGGAGALIVIDGQEENNSS